MRMKQQGFTLIELILAMVLGTVLIGSALSLFVYAIKGTEVQRAFFNNQISIDQTFSKMTDSVRRATMYKNERFNNPESENLGIIINSSQYGYRTSYPKAMFSDQEVGASNILNTKSDQLVVRYKPNKVGGYDCEGNEITSTDYSIVEKFHVKKNPTTNKLSLYCDAGRFHHTKGILGMQVLDDHGAELAEDVDLLKIRLVVAVRDEQDPNNLRYTTYDINGFRNLTDWTDPRYSYKIIGVQVGLINHSPISKNGAMQTQSSIRELVLFDTLYFINNETNYSENPNQYTVTQQVISTANGVGDL